MEKGTEGSEFTQAIVVSDLHRRPSTLDTNNSRAW